MFNLQGMMDWAAAMCNAPNVGYSQSYRNYQTVNGITYFDCSSFVFFAMWLGGGFPVGDYGYSTDLSAYQNGQANAWTVTPLTNALREAGWQQVSTDPAYWQPGDILVKTRTHCEICYSAPSPLMQMGAHGTGGGTTPLDDQVSIEPSYSGYYDQVWRDAASPPPTPPDPGYRIHGPMPAWLLRRAIEKSQEEGNHGAI